MNIEFTKLSENAVVPIKGSPGAAGYDLYSAKNWTLFPGQRHLFPTNISIKIPAGYYGRIAPRSGLAFKHGIDVLAGVIDEDYLGDIGVILLNTDHEDVISQDCNGCDYSLGKGRSFDITKGMRIAQIIFEKYYNFDFVGVDELSKTERGTGGFGSTDIHYPKSTIDEQTGNIWV